MADEIKLLNHVVDMQAYLMRTFPHLEYFHSLDEGIAFVVRQPLTGQIVKVLMEECEQVMKIHVFAKVQNLHQQTTFHNLIETRIPYKNIRIETDFEPNEILITQNDDAVILQIKGGNR